MMPKKEVPVKKESLFVKLIKLPYSVYERDKQEFFWKIDLFHPRVMCGFKYP